MEAGPADGMGAVVVEAAEVPLIVEGAVAIGVEDVVDVEDDVLAAAGAVAPPDEVDILLLVSSSSLP